MNMLFSKSGGKTGGIRNLFLRNQTPLPDLSDAQLGQAIQRGKNDLAQSVLEAHSRKLDNLVLTGISNLISARRDNEALSVATRILPSFADQHKLAETFFVSCTLQNNSVLAENFAKSLEGLGLNSCIHLMANIELIQDQVLYDYTRFSAMQKNAHAMLPIGYFELEKISGKLASIKETSRWNSNPISDPEQIEAYEESNLTPQRLLKAISSFPSNIENDCVLSEKINHATRSIVAQYFFSKTDGYSPSAFEKRLNELEFELSQTDVFKRASSLYSPLKGEVHGCIPDVLAALTVSREADKKNADVYGPMEFVNDVDKFVRKIDAYFYHILDQRFDRNGCPNIRPFILKLAEIGGVGVLSFISNSIKNSPDYYDLKEDGMQFFRGVVATASENKKKLMGEYVLSKDPSIVAKLIEGSNYDCRQYGIDIDYYVSNPSTGEFNFHITSDELINMKNNSNSASAQETAKKYWSYFEAGET